MLFRSTAYAAASDARTIAELLFGAAGMTAKQTRAYKAFLRGLLPNTSHGLHHRRLSKSLGPAIVRSSKSDLLAALATLDFSIIAPHQLDYLCTPEVTLWRAISAAYVTVGLGDAQPLPDPAWIGTPRRVREDRLVRGWAAVQERASKLVARVAPNTDLHAVIRSEEHTSELQSH